MKANHLDLVQSEHARQPPTSGDLLSCFHFEQRVLDRLAREFPAERWGYLAKGGENVLHINGEDIKVGRVCGPDGQLYKLLTDIPTTNAPIWTDDGNVAADFNTTPDVFYRPFDGGVVEPPVDPPPPPPPPPPDQLAALLQVLASIDGRLAAIEARVGPPAPTSPPLHLEGSVNVFGTRVPITLDQVLKK